MIPINVAGIKSISSSSIAFRGIGENGKLHIWGANANGILSTGNKTAQANPGFALEGIGTEIENVITASNGSSIATHSVIIKEDGTVMAVGANTRGGLGDTSTTEKLFYTQVGEAQLVANKGDVIVKQGGIAQITAKIEELNVFNKTKPVGILTYESMNTSIATVNSTGVISGVSIGQTTIIVKDITNNLETRVKVSVTNGDVSTIAFPQVETGHNHTVSLKADGTVFAWGLGTSGQLGLGTTLAEVGSLVAGATKPEQVLNPEGTGILQNIVKIAVGSNHTVALDKDGNVYTFGLNAQGQLGLGDITNRNLPELNPELSGIVDIFARFNTTFVMDVNGNVFAFGANSSGILGDLTTTARNRPVLVNGPLFNSIDIGVMEDNLLILRPDGTVIGIGRNAHGQLGRNNTTSLPAMYGNVLNSAGTNVLIDIIEMKAGDNHILALNKSGEIFAWGMGANGRIGDGGTTNRTLPVKIEGLTEIRNIKAGATSSYALAKSGVAYTWGDNINGKLGIGNSEQNQTRPVRVKSVNEQTDFANILNIAGGLHHSIILDAFGHIYGVGRNDVGQFGAGNTNVRIINRELPVLAGAQFGLISGNAVVEEGASSNIRIGVTGNFNVFGNPLIANNLTVASTDNTIFTVGNVNGNEFSITGVSAGVASIKIENEYHTDYVTVSVVEKDYGNTITVPNIRVGNGFTIMLNADGTVESWGANANGQLRSRR
jgi:alpha-tubulin suppressor-like RCC1 family protein